MQYFSLSPIRLFPSPPLSLCEIDSHSVGNLHPVGIVVQTHARSLRCPRMPAVLPPPLLLSAPISTLCSIVSVCLCSKITYLTRSVWGWLCGSHNEGKRSSSTPLIGHWVCASVVQLKFYSVTYFSGFCSSSNTNTHTHKHTAWKDASGCFL